MTNYDRIRSMSVEDLANFLEAAAEADVCIMPKLDSCEECKFSFLCDMPAGLAEEWLLSEVEE